MVIFSAGIKCGWSKKKPQKQLQVVGVPTLNIGVHKNLRKVLDLQVLNQEASKFDKDEGLLYLPRPLYQYRKQTR